MYDYGAFSFDTKADVLERAKIFWNPEKTQFWTDSGVDLVIETVADEMLVKKELFAALGRVCKAGAILATTASCLPVIECAMAARNPDHVLGMHFFGPGGSVELVEVVRTIRTAEQAVAGARTVVEKLGKTPVVCGDRAGSVVDVLLFPYLNDAVRMVEAKYASAGDIDNAMKLGCGYPKGPFEMLDELGLDVALGVQRALYRESREPGHAPGKALAWWIAKLRGEATRKALLEQHEGLLL